MVVRFCSERWKLFASWSWEIPPPSFLVSMSPDAVVGSAYSDPNVWNVSRQSPTFSRFTSCTISHAEDQVGAAVAQHQFSYASLKPWGASMSASSRRSDARMLGSVEMLGESVDPTWGAGCQ